METPVFRDYDRTALDRQYDNRNKVPGFDFTAFLEKCDAASQAARARHDCVLDVPYGPTPAETLDIFRARVPNAPVHVFFHGGYWRLLDKKDFSYLADGMVPHDVTVVVVNYALLPGVDMGTLLDQCRRSLQWVAQHVKAYGGDPSRMSISGHSAGGHIAAMLLAMEGVPALCHATAISGIFELEPIRLCFLNDTLRLTEQDVAHYSPRLLQRHTMCPFNIVVGEHEGDEYLRQSREFAAWWSEPANAMAATNAHPTQRAPLAWTAPRVFALRGVDHFSARADLGDPGSRMTALALHLS